MSETTAPLVVPVEGIGTFVFSPRRLRQEIAINVEFARLSEAVTLDGFTSMFVRAVAELKVLTLEAPDGWQPAQLDDLDAYDDATYGRLLKVWHALTDKEESFRRDRKASQTSGQGSGGELPPVVPQNLQPAAD